ncbi:hypothetical protein FO519_006003 [Halicephalobus sp. NKZ332]|nr:hypothetical protein FO519_006003 [Halicephalobus sp. NKZ332]
MLKLCPPGGEAFATAWQLTCGMRKKRSAPEPQSDLIQELQKEINPGFPDTLPTPEGLAVDEEHVEKKSSGSSKKEYRPLSMTEMMHFCCRYGCTFRDLLPYCDPFGQWDS